MNFTPLAYHEVIIPRISVHTKCEQYKHDPNLHMGMLCQKEHDEIFRDRGLTIETFNDTDTLDRIYLDQRQDDKLSLWQYKTMKLAETHTIGHTEKPVWDKFVLDGIEIYINSFEQYDPKLPYNFRYCGTYAYSKQSIVMGTRKNNPEAPDTWFFRRNVFYNKKS